MKFHSKKVKDFDGYFLEYFQDVILTSGASHALEMCISVLCERGTNLLIPCPGFSIYKTIACSLGIECRSYRLQVCQVRHADFRSAWKFAI